MRNQKGASVMVLPDGEERDSRNHSDPRKTRDFKTHAAACLQSSRNRETNNLFSSRNWDSKTTVIVITLQEVTW